MDIKKLKQLIKKPVVQNAPPKSTFGTDPNDPWSAKANIAESAALDRYLLSRGIQPKFVSKDVKVAHAKSNQFKQWLQNHQNEEVQVEDMGAMAVKSATRSAVRSSAKSAIDGTKGRADALEKSQQAYKQIKTPHGPGNIGPGSGVGSLTKKSGPPKVDRDPVSQTPRMTQEDTLIQQDGVDLGNYVKKAKEQKKELQKHTQGEYGGIAQRMLARREKGLSMAAKRMNKEEVELDEEKLSAAEKLQRAIQKQREKSAPDRARFQKRLDAIMPSPKKDVKENVSDDPKGATHADGLPPDNNTQITPARTVTEKKKEMSKSARMIKALYKHHKMVKEDLYDHEKADKSVATYGKKPKMDSSDPKDSKGENKPQAAAVLSGGSTMTGEKRDTIEIDPMMRARPGQPDPTKKKEGEKDDKKDDKKKDK